MSPSSPQLGQPLPIQVRRLLRLAESYNPTRPEQACARALHFDAASYAAVKRILQNGLEADAPPPEAPSMPNRPRFARAAQELLAGGGA